MQHPKPARCHPDKVHYAKGLCVTCYNKQKSRRSTQEWRKRNPARIRELNRKQKYGVDSAQVLRMLASQSFLCPICLAPIDESCHIDHCHTTLKVRGLLCRRCNLLLGLAKDSPNTLHRAVEYLEGFDKLKLRELYLISGDEVSS